MMIINQTINATPQLNTSGVMSDTSHTTSAVAKNEIKANNNKIINMSFPPFYNLHTHQLTN